MKATRQREQGRIARLTKGADAVEIKATIASRQVAHALARYALTQHDDEERLIYFSTRRSSTCLAPASSRERVG